MVFDPCPSSYGEYIFASSRCCLLLVFLCVNGKSGVQWFSGAGIIPSQYGMFSCFWISWYPCVCVWCACMCVCMCVLGCGVMKSLYIYTKLKMTVTEFSFHWFWYFLFSAILQSWCFFSTPTLPLKPYFKINDCGCSKQKIRLYF